ncbi:hypothetical protein CERSUDRAFT_119681 [Gelatoporia subvermispora B]|uniref:Uncharacterized protein n=1 Tax=Ceriporiopsis subvermispora (strain B) TaxID=914234 RepID=M2QY73_CERS8|nr:hypothetical protein CERSUDRAFT_119681 [Gelatoporia subvermispora B]
MLLARPEQKKPSPYRYGVFLVIPATLYVPGQSWDLKTSTSTPAFFSDGGASGSVTRHVRGSSRSSSIGDDMLEITPTYNGCSAFTLSGRLRDRTRPNFPTQRVPTQLVPRSTRSDILSCLPVSQHHSSLHFRCA